MRRPRRLARRGFFLMQAGQPTCSASSFATFSITMASRSFLYCTTRSSSAGIRDAQDLGREDAGILGAIDGHRGHRDTARHLHDRQ